METTTNALSSGHADEDAAHARIDSSDDDDDDGFTNGDDALEHLSADSSPASHSGAQSHASNSKRNSKRNSKSSSKSSNNYNSMDIGFLQQICESATPRDFLGRLAELKQSIYQSASLAGDTSTTSTKDYLDDYHGGVKPGDRRSLASSTSSDHSVGEISLDRLRAAADAADAQNAADTSVGSASSSNDTALGTNARPHTVCCCGKDGCEKASKAGGELEGIMENVEFGRQIFAELIDTFTKLQGLKSEAEEAKVRAEDQLVEAKQRIQDLEDRAERGRYASPPPPSAWPPLSPGQDGTDSTGPEIVRTRRTSASHQLPRRPGRPSTGRTISTSVPFGTTTPSSSSTDIANAAAIALPGGSTPVLGSEPAFQSRSSTPGISSGGGGDLANLPSAPDFRVLELEAAVQARETTIENLNSRLDSQAQEYQRKIDEQEGVISSLQQACEKAQTDARKAEDYWSMFEEQASLREEREKDIKDLQDEKHGLQMDIERLTGDVETWETRANELEKKERETNGQAVALKGLLEKKKDEVNELHKENKALTQDKDRLTRMVSALQMEDNLSNKLKAQLQEEASKLSSVQSELRAEKSRNNELEGDLARLKIEFEAKEGELAEAQQVDTSVGGGGTLTGSDGYPSYGKSIASQLAAVAAKERAEAKMQERPTSPDDGNVSQDTDTDRSYDEIVTTVVKKRVPRRKARTASSPLIELFDSARDDGNESDGSVTTQMAGPPRARRAPSSTEDEAESEPENDMAPLRSDDTISTITSNGDDETHPSSPGASSHFGYTASQHAKVTRAWLQSVARLVPSGTGMMHGVWPGLGQDKETGVYGQPPVLVAATVSLLVGMAIGTFVIGGNGGSDDASTYGDAVMLGLYHHHHAILPETAATRIWRVLFGSTKIMRRSIAY
ncbi:hypothetical protein OC834_002064 [Tilletia horrida]|nr:hypothetical protein OC834_002064 [Tilletia horrida]